jgi:hypothetical protein
MSGSPLNQVRCKRGGARLPARRGPRRADPPSPCLLPPGPQNAYGYELDTTYEPELPDAVVPSIPVTSAPAYQANPFSPHVSAVQQPAVAPLAFTGARHRLRRGGGRRTSTRDAAGRPSCGARRPSL